LPPPTTRRKSRQPKHESKRLGESNDTSPEERNLIVRRLQDWSRKPELNVHRVIAIVVRSGNGLSRDALIAEIGRIIPTKNAYGTVASLLTSKGNAYGRVLEDVGGIIRLHSDVEQEIRSLRWT
jgi:hypothetical protein